MGNFNIFLKRSADIRKMYIEKLSYVISYSFSNGLWGLLLCVCKKRRY